MKDAQELAQAAPSYLPFIQAYLFAWVFWMTVTLGFFGLTLLHHTVRGSWGLPVLRLFEAGNKLIPAMGIAFIPILLFMWSPDGHYLYHWIHPGNDAVLLKKAFYLNLPRFTVFQVLYFVIWTFWANKLNKSSHRQDGNNDEREAQMRADWAAPGLVVFIMSVTFAYTDWVMSLDPHWFSTIFPAWFVVGMALLCLALSTFIVTSRGIAGQQPWSDIVTKNKGFLKDMGNLMLAFTLLWAYFSLSQLLIMWSGNLPEETVYYVKRTDGIWLVLGSALLGLQFLAPFLCLTTSRTKQSPTLLRLVATLILTMRVVDIFWTVVPFFSTKEHPASPTLYAVCLVAWAILGAVWWTLFVANQKKMSVLPTHDPRLEEAMKGALGHA